MKHKSLYLIYSHLKNINLGPHFCYMQLGKFPALCSKSLKLISSKCAGIWLYAQESDSASFRSGQTEFTSRLKTYFNLIL